MRIAIELFLPKLFSRLAMSQSPSGITTGAMLLFDKGERTSACTGALVCAGGLGVAGTISSVGQGSLISNGGLRVTGTVSSVGQGSLISNGDLRVAGTVSSVGQGSLISNGDLRVTGTVSSVGQGSLISNGDLRVTGISPWAGLIYDTQLNTITGGRRIVCGSGNKYALPACLDNSPPAYEDDRPPDYAQ